MSPLAIKNWLVPEKLNLDIGCSRLALQNGKSVTTGELAIPLKSGMPNPEAVAGLRAALIALCAALPARKRVLEITLSDLQAGFEFSRAHGVTTMLIAIDTYGIRARRKFISILPWLQIQLI